jgi:sugar phosphate isomerase/epimerase
VKSFIAHVHAKDLVVDGGPRIVPVGEGTIDYRGILGSFAEDGYEGIVSIEPEFVDEKGGRPEGCARALRGARRILSAIGKRR